MSDGNAISNNGKRKLISPGSVAIVGLLLELPQAAGAVEDLRFSLVGAGLLGSAGLVVAWPKLRRTMLRLQGRRRHKFVKPWLHRDPDQAVGKATRYMEVLYDQPRLLRMSVPEFSQRSGVPEIVVDYAMKHPEQPLREDLWQDIERALFLPMGFLSGRSRKYTKAICQQRLRRYLRQGRFHAIALEAVEGMASSPLHNWVAFAERNIRNAEADQWEANQ